MKIKKFIIIFFQVVLLISSTAFCYDVGDKYILDRQGKTIPGHPDAGDRSVSIRFPHGSIAEIMAKDSVTGWYEIKVDNDTAWIIEKYFGEKYSPPPQEAAYSIGTWNLNGSTTTRQGDSRKIPGEVQPINTELMRTLALLQK